MSGLTLHDPIWLLALLPALWSVWWSLRRARRLAVVYSSLELLGGCPRSIAARLKPVLPWLRALGLALLVVALARPQKGLEEFRVRAEGISILFCLDHSGSMLALDFEEDGRRVDRLTVAKRTFSDFVLGSGGLEGRPDDRIGLIAFAGYVQSLCPLTLDHGVLPGILEDVTVPEPVTDERGRVLDRQFSRNEQQTAIGDAIARGVDRLRQAPTESKVLILLSDGENTFGVIDPRQAVEAARVSGVKIYSIGIGSTGSAPFLERDRFGRERLVRYDVRLDEELLTHLAETTGGKYFNARSREALEEVYRAIDELERTEVESQTYTQYRELYHLSLIPGALLLLLELVLSATRFSTYP